MAHELCDGLGVMVMGTEFRGRTGGDDTGRFFGGVGQTLLSLVAT